ncbi:MAG: hypothetical protein JXR12_15350 [Neptunomonas phycophila]|uniref:hypothetical protein n=1 Tax=Neptunomonas phycophila TaxID=1572645 RepID=UPI003B8B9450
MIDHTSGLKIPVTEILEGEVHTAEEQERQQDVIEVTTDLISRLYGAMFLTNRAVTFNKPSGPESAVAYKAILTEAVELLAQEFSQMKEFSFEVRLNEETGNFIVSGNNHFSKTMIGFIQMAIRAPITERRAVNYGQ